MTKTDLQLSAGYNIKFGDGSIQSVAASPANYTQAVFNQANVTIGVDASQNVRLDFSNTRMDFIDGVDVSQNNRMISIESVNVLQNTAIAATDGKMQSAYNQANVTVGVDATQNTRLTVIEGTNASQNVSINTQNNFITIIQGVNTTQNTNITLVDTKAQAAFDKANSAITNVISGNLTANSVIANNSIYTPIVYSSGGTTNLTLSDIGIVAINSNGQEFKFGASGIESSQGIYGGSYGGNKLSLNNETNLISNRYATVKIQTGTDGTVSNTWNFSGASLIFPDGTYQNTAFAGSVASSDTYARDKANAATILAQAAFDEANTGGGGGGTSISVYGEIVVDSFIGNGSNTVFRLSTTPSNINHTIVVVGGITQPKSVYSLSGANVTLTSAPAISQNVEITTIVTTSTTAYITNNIISPFLLMGA
jgi:hypothetical protein